MIPAVRHSLVTVSVVVAVCAVVSALSVAQWTRTSSVLAGLTARTTGVVVSVDGDTAGIRWQPSGGAGRTDEVMLAGTPPAVGSPVTIAYSVADPARMVVPGAARLVAADRALADASLAGVVLAGVLLVSLHHELRGVSAGRKAPVRIAGRRVRFGSGLMQRSWLETEESPQRWIPVRFDPVLMTMPAPTVLTVHGNPVRGGWSAASVDGRPIRPSGRVRRTEPPGRRVDDPLRPDDAALRRADRTGLARHLRTDLALIVPAPFVGLLWAYVVDGGAGSFAAGTAIAAAVGLWVGAVRGTDPT